MSDNVAIKVTEISKSFRLPHQKHGSIKNLFFSRLRGRRRTFEKQEVLKKVSFEIKKGEFFGIVGRNGSGKSTLLKLLAGIYSPDEGHIQINGKLTPFIELGVGFDPDLTGRENVFLNGALLGFNREEMLAMYDEIVEFAELERFMDQKLKNYSSGMQVRLAFAIAIRADTDILVLDEVLAVGDESFQKKCTEYFKDLKTKSKTVILVTHDMESVKKFCDKALIINNGEITLQGTPDRVAYEYSMVNIEESHVGIEADDEWGDKDVKIKQVTVDSKRQKNVVHTGDDFSLTINFVNTTTSKKTIHYSLGVFADDTKCFDISTYYSSPIEINPSEDGNILVKFTDFRLLPGTYKCNMSIFDESMKITHHAVQNILTLNVFGDTKQLGATGIVKTHSVIQKEKK